MYDRPLYLQKWTKRQTNYSQRLIPHSFLYNFYGLIWKKQTKTQIQFNLAGITEKIYFKYLKKHVDGSHETHYESAGNDVLMSKHEKTNIWCNKLFKKKRLSMM